MELMKKFPQKFSKEFYEGSLKECAVGISEGIPLGIPKKLAREF